MHTSRILIVDDSKAIVVMMKALLEQDYEVVTAPSAEEALSIIEQQLLDLVIMDIRMYKMSGLEALSEIKKIDMKLPVIIMTAYGTTQTAIEAMKRGAYDYVTKPFKTNEFKVLIQQALEAGRLMREPVSYQVAPGESADGACILGNSVKMHEIYKIIGKIAASSAAVLIRGENGTGKELAARAIYQNSLRKDKPFLAVNCAAIPESLLESELFGHEKDALTGALSKRIGKFQQCDQGTIFLDEIAAVPLSVQAKLLRVLQEHVLEPAGSSQPQKVDVRIIASTSRNLWKAIEGGQFREDLYYRLKATTIYMPPLRQRKEDLPLLVDYFIQKFNGQFNKNVKPVSGALMPLLKEYTWPGNVRELENVIQRAMSMATGDIISFDRQALFTQVSAEEKQMEGLKTQPGHQTQVRQLIESMLQDIPLAQRTKLYKLVVGGVEKILIEKVLSAAGQSQSKAAKMLGISRNTLRTRIKEYGL